MKTIGGAKWKTAAIMRITALTMTPALAAAVWLYGIGVLLQVAVAVVAAVLAELLCLHLRKQPLSVALDGSAAVAGMIIGAALPPLAPWFVAAFAAVCAMTLAKHCYGGLGNNVFNPAMAGYALAFVSFPRHFDNWNVDTIGSPTPLAAARLPDIADNVYSLSPILPAACALGGLVLLLLRISDWRLSGRFIVGTSFGGGNLSAIANKHYLQYPASAPRRAESASRWYQHSSYQNGAGKKQTPKHSPPSPD